VVSFLFLKTGKEERASDKFGDRQRTTTQDTKLASWHASQDPPNPRLQDQAVHTPIVMSKLERIEKVLVDRLHQMNFCLKF